MRQNIMTEYKNLKAMHKSFDAPVTSLNKVYTYTEVRFNGSIGHISAFRNDELGHLIFSSVYAKESVSISREMLHLSTDLILLNWVSDPKLFRDINRDPNTVKNI